MLSLPLSPRTDVQTQGTGRFAFGTLLPSARSMSSTLRMTTSATSSPSLGSITSACKGTTRTRRSRGMRKGRGGCTPEVRTLRSRCVLASSSRDEALTRSSGSTYHRPSISKPMCTHSAESHLTYPPRLSPRRRPFIASPTSSSTRFRSPTDRGRS